MTRDQAIAIARQAAAAKPESYMNLPPGAEFMPHEWVIDAILCAHNNASANESPPATTEGEEPDRSVRALVLDMRDAFLTMVAGYNAVGAYNSARDAQTMALALHKYEDEHQITVVTWPMEIVRDDYGKGLKTTDNRVIYGEDL